MKALLMRCLMVAALATTTLLASAKEKEDTLCIGGIIVRPAYEPVKSIFKAENDSIINKYVVVHNDDIFGDLNNDNIFGDVDDDMASYPVRWVLTETSDRTILHCYVKMTTPLIRDFYLGGIDKASIVDLETGKIYEARGSYDPQVWNRAFNVAAPMGTVLDFPIEFPLLPKETKMVFVYGVPLCNLNGVGDAHNGINIRDNNFGGYDEVPHLKVPRLIKEEGENYDANDWDTWAAYADVHTVRPCKDGVMALWRTPETTYLTVAYEQNWRTEYFNFDSFRMCDADDKTYKVKKVQGITNPEHLFMSHAEPGSWVCFTLEFEPLPLSAQYIALQYNDDGAKEGTIINSFYVNTLRSNQKYFEYFKPEVTTLQAPPMAVKTSSFAETLDDVLYRFKLIDSKTKQPVDGQCYLLKEGLSNGFSVAKDGIIISPQFISSARAVVFYAEGYDMVVLPMSNCKPGKDTIVKMKKSDGAK